MILPPKRRWGKVGRSQVFLWENSSRFVSAFGGQARSLKRRWGKVGRSQVFLWENSSRFVSAFGGQARSLKRRWGKVGRSQVFFMGFFFKIIPALAHNTIKKRSQFDDRRSASRIFGQKMQDLSLSLKMTDIIILDPSTPSGQACEGSHCLQGIFPRRFGGSRCIFSSF